MRERVVTAHFAATSLALTKYEGAGLGSQPDPIVKPYINEVDSL